MAKQLLTLRQPHVLCARGWVVEMFTQDIALYLVLSVGHASTVRLMISFHSPLRFMSLHALSIVLYFTTICAVRFSCIYF